MTIVVVPLAVARARGFWLQRFSKQDLPEARGFQTSIRSMLIATVVVACLLAFGASVCDANYMWEGGRTTSLAALSTAVMLVGLPTLFLSSAALSVWATLSAGAVRSRMVVGGAVLAAGGAFLPYVLNGDAVSYAYWAGLPLLTFLITSFTLLAFRWAGYRFVRGNPKAG